MWKQEESLRFLKTREKKGLFQDWCIFLKNNLQGEKNTGKQKTTSDPSFGVVRLQELQSSSGEGRFCRRQCLLTLATAASQSGGRAAPEKCQCSHEGTRRGGCPTTPHLSNDSGVPRTGCPEPRTLPGRLQAPAPGCGLTEAWRHSPGQREGRIPFFPLPDAI